MSGFDESPYQYLNGLSTDTIRQILRDNLFADDAHKVSDEFIEHAMEVIADREKDDPSIPVFDTDKSWNDFLQNYYPEDAGQQQTPASAPVIHSPHAVKKAWSSQPKRAGHKFFRIIFAAAVTVGLCAAAAGAFEFNLFKWFASWTQDIFQFQVEETANGTYLTDEQTLKPDLSAAGITTQCVPTWVPDGYQFESKDILEKSAVFTAYYWNAGNGDSIRVTIRVASESKRIYHEKDVNEISCYTHSGIDHYIMHNNGQLTTVWDLGNLECTIDGGISENSMKTMIDSIYEEKQP